MTYHTAHNYGALLQAYALKNYIIDAGYNVVNINYTPEKVSKVYAISPFQDARSIKSIISNFLKLRYKLNQHLIFNRFIKNQLLAGGKSIAYEEALEKCDAIIVGSDQVWNDDITDCVPNYFIPEKDKGLVKISYAASFGKRKLSAFQKECIEKYLSDFDAISIREEDGKEEIERALNKNIEIVLDPVFLLGREKWLELARFSNIQYGKIPYIFYYALSEDKELIKQTEDLAQQKGYRIIIVHPIGTRQSISGIQLYNVGPIEFLDLLLNAAVVATNSFHATAFSVIFGKNYFHIKQNSSESRVESLLSRISAYNCPSSEYEGLLELSNIDMNQLNKKIDESKAFLKKALAIPKK